MRFSVDNIAFVATLVTGFLLTASQVHGQTLWYVDDDAPPGGDGLSWNTAYSYLQDALLAAAADPTTTEIRVAHGLYKPDQDEGQSVTPGDREATFQLVNGVAIYGGYAGLGTADPNERDIELCETVLSGDLAGDDGSDFSNNNENSYHVVTSTSTGAASVLDGVVITAGNANGDTVPDKRGAGMWNELGSPTIRRCVFRNNAAEYQGGAMYHWNFSNPIVTTCTFVGNCGSEGGAISCMDWSDALIINCSFVENSAQYNGGAVHCFGQSDPTISNCILLANSATSGLGPQISATSLGQSQYACHPSVAHSDVQGGLAEVLLDTWCTVDWGDGNITTDPLLMDPNGLDDIIGTADDDLRLQPGSPCINAGNPAYAPAPGETDLDGHVRVLCGRVDMGAYEFGIGDFDCNETVNLADFGWWPACMTGPDAGPYPAGCEAFDFEYDADVDLHDFAKFSVLFLP